MCVMYVYKEIYIDERRKIIIHLLQYYYFYIMKVKTKARMKIIFAIFRIFSQIHRQAERKNNH